ncbi:MAG TPA: helix-hairpin-helix domain-containing protein [Chitinophagaceae bacterium]|nr:helix-hairpin-helix domain-containing protein [Chitinophagaceae bacterium]
MSWQKFVADYLTFTRRDRIAVIVILVLIVSVFFLPKALPGKQIPDISKNNDTSWIAAMRRIETMESEKDEGKMADNDENNSFQYDRRTPNRTADPKGELFYFDPNTLSAEGWKRLGLRDKTITTILKYLDKGGKFKIPEDLKKIYGLYTDEYERIAPYIRIAEKNPPTPDEQLLNPTVKNNSPKSRYSIIDINTADTTSLIALPGIGSKLATRIINFREKLGGFYSVNQVGETFGLPDSTFQNIKQYLKLGTVSIRKININLATTEELKNHPYIKWSIANPIVAYRKEHGPFSNVEDIKKVMAVTEEVYIKIAPYLTVQ